jgi:hypothetical protein
MFVLPQRVSGLKGTFPAGGTRIRFEYALSIGETRLASVPIFGRHADIPLYLTATPSNYRISRAFLSSSSPGSTR